MVKDLDAKFKYPIAGSLRICCGVGEVTGKYICERGKIVEKDYYYKDYCVKFKNGTEEWFKEKDIQKINDENGGSK